MAPKPEHRTYVDATVSVYRIADAAQPHCTCGWHGTFQHGADSDANYAAAVAEAILHYSMPVAANGRLYGYVDQPADLPQAILEADDDDITCAICGELVGDRDDVGYTVEPDGSYKVFHTRQYHRERCAIIGHRFNALGVCMDCDVERPAGPVCIYSTDHGDCGQPAHYSLTAISDGHTAYSCEYHFTKTLVTFGDYEGDFDVRVLKGSN